VPTKKLSDQQLEVSLKNLTATASFAKSR